MSDEDTKPDTLAAILTAATRAANEAVACRVELHELRGQVQAALSDFEMRLETRFRSIEARLAALEGLTPGPD